MKIDRAKFSLMNLGSSGIKNIITTLVGFVSTPYIVRSLGDTDFGIYKTLVSFFGHFSILEFGLYSTILSLFIKEANKDKSTTAGEILHWGIRKYSQVMKLSLGASIIFSVWLYFEFYKQTNSSELVISLIFCQAFFLILPTLPYRAYLEAHHQTYKVNLIQLLNAILYTSFALFFTYILPGLSSLMLATIIGLVVSQLLYRFNVPVELKEKMKFSSFKVANKIQLSFFLNEVSGRICLMSDDIIISFMIGPKYVVPLFITQKLPQIIQGQLLNIGNSTWSTLGVLYHEGEKELFKKRLVELTKFTSIFGASCLLVLAIFNQSFVNLWIDPKEFAGTAFTVVSCLNAFLLPIFTIWGWCFNYTQLVDKITPMMWIQALVNLSLSIFLTYKYGIFGTILGTLLAYVLVPLPFLSVMLKRYFDINLVKLHSSWALPLLFSMILYAGLAQFPTFAVCEHWAELIIKMILVGSVCLGILTLVFFSKTEMKENRERVMKLFRKKK